MTGPATGIRLSDGSYANMDCPKGQSPFALSEIWSPISGWLGFQVSSLGRVKSPTRGILKGRKITRGAHSYITVNFNYGGRRATPSVHRLVLEAFKGECPDGMEGCHNDGDGTNNRILNLRWDTHAANMKDGVRQGRFKARFLAKNVGLA